MASLCSIYKKGSPFHSQIYTVKWLAGQGDAAIVDIRAYYTLKAMTKRDVAAGQERQKPKRSLFDHFINGVSVLIIACLLVGEFSHLHKPKTPMGEYTALYGKHYHFSFLPPFVISYYLLAPKDYDPAYKYPLVLALHGVSDYVYAGYFLARPEFRARYPAFVVVPIASKRSAWAEPENKSYALQRQGLQYPDALPQAAGIIRGVQKRYTIDADRIYVTGHSAGGIGTFGALARYPDIFAAGVVSAGLWDPLEAPEVMRRPVWAFHGAADRQIPASVTRELMRNIANLGGTPKYTEFPGAGHGIWNAVYENNVVWDWLFGQRLKQR